MTNIEELIGTEINKMRSTTGLAEIQVSSDTNILKDTGVDSLGLANIVVLLEEQTGRDPFESGFTEFVTVGDLAALYQNE